MSKVCPNCQHERTPEEDEHLPDWRCPVCQIVYAKYDEIKAREDAEKKKRLDISEQKKAKEKAEAKARLERSLKKNCICTDCGFSGDPKTETRGHILIEIILWLCFLIPGLIYTTWRHISRYKACPKCKHESMIPCSSVKGEKLFYELYIDK